MSPFDWTCIPNWAPTAGSSHRDCALHTWTRHNCWPGFFWEFKKSKSKRFAGKTLESDAVTCRREHCSTWLWRGRWGWPCPKAAAGSRAWKMDIKLWHFEIIICSPGLWVACRHCQVVQHEVQEFSCAINFREQLQYIRPKRIALRLWNDFFLLWMKLPWAQE